MKPRPESTYSHPTPNHPASDREAEISFRDELTDDDPATVRAIVSSTGFFSPAEIDMAVELVADRLVRGERSGYRFLFAECHGATLGYTCFGPIVGTEASCDLFWIAVAERERGTGVGRMLLARTERALFEMGGTRVYVETSSRPQYQPTRRFYERCGYRVEATIQDFYAPGDHKVIMVKELSAVDSG